MNEITLPKSGEWLPRFRSWTFLQIRRGISYWQEPNGAREFSPGTVLIITGETQGGFRASQLNEVVITYFCMEPDKLTGLLSLGEQHAFKRAASLGNLLVLPPTHVISERFKNLHLSQNGPNLSIRLQLLQLFVDLFEGEFEEQPADAMVGMDGRGRLRQMLKQMAASEFIGLSLSDLVPRMRCSPRHLSRLFRQEVGTSFREKQTELRLLKACDLLATSDAKVVDVALTSGYQSTSLFSLLFKRQFGVSPGEWRQRQGKKIPGRQKLVRMLPV